MKILFGATVYSHLINFHIPYMQYFQKQGYEIYAIANGDEDKKPLEELGIRCIEISFSRNPFSKDNVIAYKQLHKLFKKHHFDLVHVHTPVAALLTRFVYRKYKAGVIVYTAHGFHFFKGAPKLNWLIYYPLEKIAAKWTNHLFVMNNEDYHNARKIIATEKLSLVHGVGVEFSPQRKDLKQLKEELAIKKDSVVITYIAELNGNKNHQYLLRNWSNIKIKCPQAILLVIGTGEIEETLKAYVQTNNLQDVRFLGHRRDVEQLLQIAHINTLLSYREGLPKSTIESMYVGVPNIVTNTRGLRDLIRDGKNGFVIEHDASEQLIERFVQLIQNATLREQMGDRAQSNVQLYLLGNVLPEYTKVYKNLLK